MTTLPDNRLRSIGDVIRELKPEFPDLTVSKVRFLETKGLVIPARTPTGFRRYSATDIERITYVLRMQRERYLPLKVIKEHLNAMSRGLQPPEVMDSTPKAPKSEPESLNTLAGSVGDLVLTQAELLQQSGLDTSELKVLDQLGLIDATRGSHFDGTALNIATAVAKLADYGITARHMRPIKLSVDRIADLIGQVTSPMSARPDGQTMVEDASTDIAALVLQIQALVIGQRFTSPK